jgi:hypothetical protein
MRIRNAEYFSRQDSTIDSPLGHFAKFDFWRTRFSHQTAGTRSEERDRLAEGQISWTQDYRVGRN